MEQSRLYYLFDRYTAGAITSEEELELAGYAIDPANNADFTELEIHYWERLKDVADPLPDSANRSLQTILPAVVMPLRKRIKVAVAAACIFVLLGTGSYFLFFHPSSKTKETVQASLFKDVEAPKTNKATITTSGGKIIYLDSVNNGQLAVQDNVQLVKTGEGEISYEPIAGSQEAGIPSTSSGLNMTYHTLNNPKGSKVVDITLADGSHVWLNAGSSLTYPVAFVGNERKISMTGEAYFEVNPHPLKGSEKIPFFVDANGTTTQVLGTHFNVNAYDDEDAVRVTLLEGSVRLTQNAQSEMLKPGDQGIAKPSALSIQHSSNIEEVMAWKNGLFSLNKTDIQTFMRMVGRWYDVDVIYEGEIPKGTISGEAQRSLSFLQMQKVLQLNDVHFRAEGRKLIVTK